MAQGADGGEVVLHGQQHVGGTHETGLGELLLCLDEAADDKVLMRKGETATRAEVAELDAIADETDALGIGLLVFLLGIVSLKLAFQLVHEFGDGGQDGHLPKHGAPQQTGHLDVEMAFLVLAHLNLVGPHVETTQESEEPQREIVALLLHEMHFVVGDLDVAVKVELLAQFFSETLGIHGVVAVHECVLPYGTSEFLQIGIAHTEVV